MRKKFDILAYAEGRTGQEATAVHRPMPLTREEDEADPYLEARHAAFQHLNAHYQEAMVSPFDHELEVERAIAEAVAQGATSGAQARQLREDLAAHILGMGPLQIYLDDPRITEIMVNGRDVYVEKEGLLHPELPLPSEEDAFRLAESMAEKMGERFQLANPILDFTWKDGSRVHLTHPIISSKGVTVTIRKPDRSKPLDLASLVGYRTLSGEMAEFLVRAVNGRLNVIISGSTGAGKTTLLRALAHEALRPNPHERILVIEDTEELHLRHPHTIPFRAYTSKNKDEHGGRSVDVQELTKSSKRMRPDRVFVGEVRGAEAMDLLDVTQSEVSGILATIHLRSPEDLPKRMYFIGQRSGMGIDPDHMASWVYDTIDLVVHVSRDRLGRRRVTRVVELLDGEMVDLFHYDPRTDAHTKVRDLSERRTETIAMNDITVPVEEGAS